MLALIISLYVNALDHLARLIKRHGKLLINTMHVGISVLSFAMLDVYCASSDKQQLVVTHVARHFLYFSASQTLLNLCKQLDDTNKGNQMP
jgi:predicted TIM-barrel fold metal-dependent hydrolase